MLERAWKKEPAYTVGRDAKLVQPLWKVASEFLKKLKRELPFDPAIPLLGIPTQVKTIIQKDTCTPMFKTELFTIAKIARHGNLNIYRQRNG